MKKFEYKVHTIPTKGWMKYKQDFETLQVQLNEFGKQGWEVSVTVNSAYQAGSYSANVIILKREIAH